MAKSTMDKTGRAYGMPKPTYDPILTEVGPGTPGGELLRRYWHPIAPSSECTDLPKEVRRFGEDLILFRNKKGEPGLLYPRCVHRGTSLLYGQVEEDGIRCCYHGWKFDVEGNCLEQPCEPEGGRNRYRVRQPWYPVVEEYGAIWAYMGPPERQPLFPIFSCFEDLADDEEVVTLWASANGEAGPFPLEHNWCQLNDNAVDFFHVVMLHTTISGPQFDWEPRYAGRLPEARWDYSADGRSVLGQNIHPYDDAGNKWGRLEQHILPNIISFGLFIEDGPTDSIHVMLPFDDTHCAHVVVARRKKNAPQRRFESKMPDGSPRKRWIDMTLEERQRFPTDYEAQGGQGPTTFHSEEHLTYTDTGLAMQRRIFKQQCEVVANGGDPIGVAFKEEDRRVLVEARSWPIPAPQKVQVKEPA